MPPRKKARALDPGLAPDVKSSNNAAAAAPHHDIEKLTLSELRAALMAANVACDKFKKKADYIAALQALPVPSSRSSHPATTSSSQAASVPPSFCRAWEPRFLQTDEAGVEAQADASDDAAEAAAPVADAGRFELQSQLHVDGQYRLSLDTLEMILRRGVASSPDLPLDPIVKTAALGLAFEHHKNRKIENAAIILRVYVQATEARGVADFDACNLLAECLAMLQQWGEMSSFLNNLQNQWCAVIPFHSNHFLSCDVPPQPLSLAFRVAAASSIGRGSSGKEQQRVSDNGRGAAGHRAQSLRVGRDRPSHQRPLRPCAAVNRLL